MDMNLLHDHNMEEREEVSESKFSPRFLESFPYEAHKAPSKFVAIPDGLYCGSGYNFHGYPSFELSKEESLYFLLLVEKCPNCFCAQIENSRQYMLGSHDFMDEHFGKLNRKFDSFENLLSSHLYYRYFNEQSLKLVREVDTKKETTTAGPVLEMPMELPEGILEDGKISFHQFLKKLYKKKMGFVKGKYLVICTELLLRQCEGDKTEFLEVLLEAYSLVESRYCSISRLALEGGFWQVCPELGGFFWKDNNMERDFLFLRKFLQKTNIRIRNISLTMGPHYLIGGGYFSYIYSIVGNVVMWYIPNFWQEGFTQYEKSCFYNAENFWYGWYRHQNKSYYGCPYNGIIANECDSEMLEFLPTAMYYYYK